MSATEPDFTVALPPEWKTSEFRAVAPVAEASLPGGRQALLSSVLLEDGSSVIALSYPGGQRLARTSPHNDWATEERYSGRIVTGRTGARLARIWKLALESMRFGRQAAERDPTPDEWASVLKELGQYGVRPGEGWDREGRLRR